MGTIQGPMCVGLPLDRVPGPQSEGTGPLHRGFELCLADTHWVCWRGFAGGAKLLILYCLPNGLLSGFAGVFLSSKAVCVF